MSKVRANLGGNERTQGVRQVVRLFCVVRDGQSAVTPARYGPRRQRYSRAFDALVRCSAKLVRPPAESHQYLTITNLCMISFFRLRAHVALVADC